jgi:uncharacterized protein (DUF952 family)
MTIYHLVLPEYWARFQGLSHYQAATFEEEGFIHCSFDSQIEGVLGRYFQGVEKVTILALDTEKIEAKLVVEVAPNGEDFPHIYGPINMSAVTGVSERIL